MDLHLQRCMRGEGGHAHYKRCMRVERRPLSSSCINELGAAYSPMCIHSDEKQ
jgi:hypothetical protein